MSQPDINSLKLKLNEYTTQKTELEQQVKTVERDLIIKEEQLKQVKENLIKTFGTDDINVLNEKLISLNQEVQELENKLENK